MNPSSPFRFRTALALALTVGAFALGASPAGAVPTDQTDAAPQAAFTSDTVFVHRVVSTEPLVVDVELSGTTAYGPEDFGGLQLRGDATFLFAVAGQDVQLHTAQIDLPGPGRYSWSFPAFENTDAAHPVQEISGPGGSDVELAYTHQDGGSYSLHASFEVRFAPGVEDDVRALHLHNVIFTQRNAPYIDVFTP